MENSAVIVENVGILLIGAFSCVCCVAWLLNSDIACISKPFICLLLLVNIVSVVILWLLWLRNSSNTILAYNNHKSSGVKSWLHVGNVIGSLCNKCLKFHHTSANWFDCLFCFGDWQNFYIFVGFQGPLSTPPQLGRPPVRRSRLSPQPRPRHPLSQWRGSLRSRPTTATTREARSPTISTNW